MRAKNHRLGGGPMLARFPKELRQAAARLPSGENLNRSLITRSRHSAMVYMNVYIFAMTVLVMLAPYT